MAILIGSIPPSSLTLLIDEYYVEKQPVALKEYFTENWSEKLQESVDKCTDCCDIIDIMLEMELKTTQSIIFSHVQAKSIMPQW